MAEPLTDWLSSSIQSIQLPLEPERTNRMRCTLIGRGSALKPIAVNCGMGRERANTSAILAGQNGAAPQGDDS